jgi:hypothetical protein
VPTEDAVITFQIPLVEGCAIDFGLFLKIGKLVLGPEKYFHRLVIKKSCTDAGPLL